ncbi:hypothetical protein E2562_029003 [Oryza meyeriana var. granulata]|uniref:Uncharacterized protein n=1 Tax=Oryza meyeriana var. granulata TaxID=110450 RepID=A0A6G1E365_9ORYZ|nr:hypothetical protein E2562_029003 [Oryza meyeriana var. granulata]
MPPRPAAAATRREEATGVPGLASPLAAAAAREQRDREWRASTRWLARRVALSPRRRGRAAWESPRGGCNASVEPASQAFATERGRRSPWGEERRST